MQRETIVVLDFGSQYTQLIARRVREHKVYCEIHPYNIPLNQLAAIQPKGIILSGGPASVYATDAPLLDPEVLTLGVDFSQLTVCSHCTPAARWAKCTPWLTRVWCQSG